jgi:hypothetical protein
LSAEALRRPLTAEPVEKVDCQSCKENRLSDFELWLGLGLFCVLTVRNRIEARAGRKSCYQSLRINEGKVMAKTIVRTKRVVRRDWTRAEVKELRQHSKDRTRVKTISRALKRTPGALRQKARVLGIPLGHQRTKKK